MRISSLVANVSIVQALLENNDRPIVLPTACRDVFDHEATLGAGMDSLLHLRYSTYRVQNTVPRSPYNTER